MKKRQPKNVTASVKNRLLTLARDSGEEFNLLLIRYGIERFLYRLSQSAHADGFVLKGAILFGLWARAPHRPTRDVDLLSGGPSDLARMETVVQEVCRQKVADDGVDFDPDSVRAERIQEGEKYEGIRAHLDGRLGNARIRLQIDIGFGDAVTPRPVKRDLPCLLDSDAPRLRVYPRETVVAEKFQALVELGMTNSRMKDFFDLRYMAKEFEFEGLTLSKAIRATFERRKTGLPEGLPVALSKKFTEDAAALSRWTAFLRRSRLHVNDLALPQVADEIWTFLKPVTEALLAKSEFDKTWKPGVAWR